MENLSYAIAPNDIEPEIGHCFTAIIPQFARGDTPDAPNASSLELWEDGKRLGPAHALHDDIRKRGRGAYSHWGDVIYFSSSDNADPRAAGRRFEVRGGRREGYIPHPKVVRSHEVVPAFIGSLLPQEVVDEMEAHPYAAGKSSWGTRNVLQAFVLSMRPQSVLEIGAHIGSASVVIGAALKANGSGTLYCLEPQQHYFRLLKAFVDLAGVSQHVRPLQMMSTSRELDQIVGGRVDMIYLDADHSYSAAKTDLVICDRLLNDNGLLFLDDVGPELSASIDPENKGGVRQALLEHCEARSDLHVIFFEPPFWLTSAGMAMVCKQRIDKRR